MVVETRRSSRRASGAITSIVPAELIKSERQRRPRKNRKVSRKAKRRKTALTRNGDNKSEDEMLGYDDVDRIDSNKRMLMRDWLIKQVEKGEIRELKWLDTDKSLLKVPWLHGSRHGWQNVDCELFKRWAMHTGKFDPSEYNNSKRWKANFRCAINSLPDVDEVSDLTNKKGVNAYRVYRFKPAKPKRSQCKRISTKRPTWKGDERLTHTPHTYSPSSIQQQRPLYIKIEPSQYTETCDNPMEFNPRGNESPAQTVPQASTPVKSEIVTRYFTENIGLDAAFSTTNCMYAPSSAIPIPSSPPTPFSPTGPAASGVDHSYANPPSLTCDSFQNSYHRSGPLPKLPAFEAMGESSKALHQTGGQFYEKCNSPGTNSTVSSPYSPGSQSCSSDSQSDEENSHSLDQQLIQLIQETDLDERDLEITEMIDHWKHSDVRSNNNQYLPNQNMPTPREISASLAVHAEPVVQPANNAFGYHDFTALQHEPHLISL